MCQGPSASRITWYNDSGVLQPWGVDASGTGRSCPYEAGEDPDYPYGLFCTPYRNPGEGGYRHFDNMAVASLTMSLYVATQDW